MEGTFHRRELKLPSIAFGSAEGKSLFRKALQEGYMEGYFQLAEHFITQGHPAFCGIGSLSMALNALLVDPQRVWLPHDSEARSVWRWFDESMLTCCEPLDVVRLKGITLPKLACLGRCNGADVDVNYATDISLEQFRNDVLTVTTLRKSSKTPSLPLQHEPSPTSMSPSTQEAATIEETVPLNVVMIVSYCRKVLSQTGCGHFSPIGGYHADTDMVLILDVARFKYPPHWVPLPLLYASMRELDKETGHCRGYMMLRSSDTMRALSSCCCSHDDSKSSDVTPSATQSTGALIPAAVAAANSEDLSVTADLAKTHLHTLLNHSCSSCCK